MRITTIYNPKHLSLSLCFRPWIHIINTRR